MSGLDDVDRAILDFLQDDARISFAEIARKIGIGESTVRYRVNRLKENGIIVRSTTLLNPRKLGLSLTGMVLLKVKPKYLDSVLRNLVSLEESYHVFQSTGEHDFLVIVHARDMEHLSQIVDKMKKLTGVVRASFHLITSLPKIGTKL